MNVTTRKAALGGLAMLGAAVLLAGCASAPEDSDDSDGASRLRLPALHGLRRRRLRRQVVQPARLRGPRRRRPTSSASSSIDRRVRRRDRLRAEHRRAWSTRAATSSSRSASRSSAATVESADGEPRHRVRLDRRRGRQRLRRRRPTPRTSSRSSSTPPRRRSSPATPPPAYSKTGVVGTFGGMNFPTVSIFMDGFKQGVEYYNEREGHDRRRCSAGTAPTASSPVASRPNDTRSNAAQGLIDQGVDVLLPVGGPIYQSAAAAIRDSGREIALIGVDADVYETDPIGRRPAAHLDPQGHRRRHVRGRHSRPATASSTTTPFVGTLENEGVGLAPFHDFESKVPPDAAGRARRRSRPAIIDGDDHGRRPTSRSKATQH